MIINPQRLYEGCPPGTIQAYKLRLLEHFMLRPLAEAWDITVTSAYRSISAQNAMVSNRKAKGTSQHSLGEAADFVPKGDMLKCFVDCQGLRPHQLILEYDGIKPDCIHISMPSEHADILPKTLLFYNGLWRNFDGTFPVQA